MLLPSKPAWQRNIVMWRFDQNKEHTSFNAKPVLSSEVNVLTEWPTVKCKNVTLSLDKVHLYFAFSSRKYWNTDWPLNRLGEQKWFIDIVYSSN